MIEKIQLWMQDPVMARIATSLLVLLAVVVAVQILHRMLVRYISDSGRRYHMRKAATALGYVLAIFLLSLVFSDKLSSLTIAFGVAGAGIAFALQEVIASIAGWVAVSFGRFYQVGDRVQLGGIMGDVIDIGVLRTTLMECGGWVKGDVYNGRIVRVANSFIFKEPVYNYSADFPFLWDELVIPVRYGSNHDLARKLFSEVLTEVTGEFATASKEVWTQMTHRYLVEDARVDPMVTMVANDNWVEYTLRYVVDYKKRRLTKDQITVKLLDAIDQTRGQIRLGSQTIELVAVAPLDVNMTASAPSSPQAE
ncbi:MAG: mechanosensitive ion channel domain-containing protein [Gammaproteobacteria bacterium]